MIALRKYMLLKKQSRKFKLTQLETADIDVTNNTWPKERVKN
jgi:hypothetical protein